MRQSRPYRGTSGHHHHQHKQHQKLSHAGRIVFMLVLLAVFQLLRLLPAVHAPHTGVALLLIPDAAMAQSADESRPQALFNRGNYMMEEQNYDEAVSIFRQIEQNGHASGPLFYNMGISYLYLDSLGLASYYFHKSKSYRESASRAHEGIAATERMMRTRGTFIPQLPWYAFYDWFLFRMNHLAWVVWGLVFINIGVLVILAGWLWRPDRRIAIAGMVVTAVGIVQIVVVISLAVWADGYRQGVVVQNGIPVTPAPDLVVDEDLSPDLAYEAYTVTLDIRLSSQHEGWVHVRLRNGISGWIPDSAVRKL